ncbi:hypothetical protein C5746_35285 [Streptomyces atratus]|uniref:Glycosyltransferase RgtA/B/C/D-like domain-containing protein n=1 Tax=Streptomyces atratus TaxID=1893 RepID=A0A2Z5JM88_STRAR|nr:hypothetical protein C5746_35285 [Streptomyces atratus]
MPESAIATVQPRTLLARSRTTSAPRATVALGRRCVVVVPVLLALVQGLWGLRRDGAVWHDEAVTIGLASRDLADLWQTLGRIDAVHGLYYLLMHGLFDVFGTDVVVLRLPSVLAAAAAAGGVAMIGLHLAGPRAGLCAGIVFVVLPGVQRYAQEGRSYALVCALVVWATYSLVRAVERDRRGMWAAYTALLLTACLVHEFAVLALAAHALVVPRAMRRTFVAAAVRVVAGLAPLVLVSMRQSTQVGWLDATKPDEYAHFSLMVGVALAAVWIAVAGRRTRTACERRLVVLGLGLFLVPTGLLMLLALAKPLYLDRYVLYGVAGLALLLGAAFDQVLRRGRRIRAGAVVAAVVACAALVPTALDLRTPASRSDDMTALAAVLRETVRPDDGLVYLSVKRRAWELAEPRPAPGVDLARARGPLTSHSLYGTEVAPDELRARMLARHRIVAIASPSGVTVEDSAMARVKHDTLADHFEACGKRTVDGSVITVYARPGRC